MIDPATVFVIGVLVAFIVFIVFVAIASRRDGLGETEQRDRDKPQGGGK